MIAKIDPRTYDVEGRKTLLPKKASLNFRPTFAMGTYLTCPLEVRCASMDEIRQFLRTCRYMSDPEQFGHRDYWMRPTQFEKSRAGDCEDFALWTWRQMIDLGYDARFVLGYVSYSRSYHAWVTYRDAEGESHLLEPLAADRRRLSRLGLLLHRPQVSVGVDDGRLNYRSHQPTGYVPSWTEALGLSLSFVAGLPAWFYRTVRYWLRAALRFARSGLPRARE